MKVRTELRWPRASNPDVRGPSVEPPDGNPLRIGHHRVHGELEFPDGFVDFVVDDFEVEQVLVGSFEHVARLDQTLHLLALQTSKHLRFNS